MGEIDIAERVLSAFLIINPYIYKIVKSKIPRYLLIISSFFLTIFLTTLIYNLRISFEISEVNFLLGILTAISLENMVEGIRNKKFSEVIDLLLECEAFKKVEYNIDGKFTENDVERIKDIVRLHLNPVSFQNNIGNLKLSIKKKKHFNYIDLKIDFSKNATEEKIKEIVNIYENLKSIGYMDDFEYNEKKNYISVVIRDSY